ncbi:sensor histidine kinase [Allostreptomyces psammosilenae]|uniref:histidine kinase n=1 Tax=Allostreptomyces psammosilenae TaxID=1892865 RepID=A0A852ZZQ3_9ACTN|nr:sensor histidine kinase [Allostreptomyces psammosilenae]NYI07816.1 signal transduction histidine kinase [Allostreptomyces psammosilenae]
MDATSPPPPPAPSAPAPLPAPHQPLLKRLPFGTWTALAWCAALVYAAVGGVRLPGEADYHRPGGSVFTLGAGHWALLAVAAATTLAGSVLLRRRPLTALGLLLAGSTCTAMALTSTEITFTQFMAAEVALAHIAATRPRRSSVVAAVMALGVLFGYAVARLMLGFFIGTSTELAVALTTVIAWLVGDSIRLGREQALTAHSQAVTAERLRIARELHDMVAHSIGIIAIQAGAARMVIDTQPTRARDALGAIENASRETLSGLRRMLGALRQAEGASGRGGAATAPGLADVDRLAAATTAAGVHVEVRWRGERRPLPAEIDLSAFRIIQEAVTNVVRHAGARRCRVTVDQRDGELAIEVVDSGRGVHGRGATAGAGYGIVGMRERVALLHGDFTAGPRAEGGFRVAARLPVSEPVVVTEPVGVTALAGVSVVSAVSAVSAEVPVGAGDGSSVRVR